MSNGNGQRSRHPRNRGDCHQSGIGSTVASLWLVEDEATAIMMPQFYRHWEAGEGRASALQSMQKDWLSKTQNSPYRHPGYWAPFILVGNWL
ncbi:MAG: CHAT domain-containing protein [Synechococcales cyanobacterium RU_4_20]|nr:CHAT domain-containing protein [Synechococcales cyanobacterium RU_4_20]